LFEKNYLGFFNIIQKFKNGKKREKIMKDINEIMPKIPNMRWGALLNRAPTNKKVKQLDRMLPHDKRWHTVFEDQDTVYVDDVSVKKQDPEKWT
jgi:hypothetical protein